MFNVVPATQYYEQMLAAISKAKQRVAIIAMLGIADAKVEPLLDELVAAAKRKVEVTFFLDDYSKLIFFQSDGDGATRRKRLEKLSGFMKILRGFNANAQFIGRHHINPFAGRHHFKATVVDNESWSFGGVNLSRSDFKRIDYMLHSSKPEVAEILLKIINDAPHSTADQTIKLNDTNQILFDAGSAGRSIIYDRACALAADSKHITYVSQFMPSGRLNTLIANTANETYFNRAEQTDVRMQTSQLINRWSSKLKNRHIGRGYIHAKYMLFTLHSGEQVLLSGSHNFKKLGVTWGTQEIALESHDSNLFNELQEFTSKHID